MTRRKSDLIILATVWLAAIACLAAPLIEAASYCH